MTYADFFAEVKARLMGVDVSGIGEHLAFQFNIVGEGEGCLLYTSWRRKAISRSWYERSCDAAEKAESPGCIRTAFSGSCVTEKFGNLIFACFYIFVFVQFRNNFRGFAAE